MTTDTRIDRDATVLARFLLARGVTADSRVGVEHEGSYEMAVAALAVSKTGATCVRLDPARPEHERRDRALDTCVSLVLTLDDAIYEAPSVPASLFAELWTGESRA